MNYQIRVAQSDIEFECAEGMTVLDAARRSGYELPYSCRTGICGSCKGRLVSGSIDMAAASEALSEEERAAGYTLFCQARPTSDVEIGARSITKLDPNAHQTVDAKVYKLSRGADDVTLLQLRFPAGKRVRFKAGQYLQVLLPDGSRRSYSMANPPQQNDGVLLHIRHLAGGRFSAYLESTAAVGDIVRLQMPFGDFYLRDDAGKPLVFVASGTGFAPIKSILEDMFKRGAPQRPVSLYWGARRRADLYQRELPEKWAKQYPGFRFIPVLSDEDDGESRTGFVHHAVMADFPSLAGHEVYACGVPAMITAARSDFTGRCGLPSDAFFCDAFVTEAAQD
ncbi:CDP-6-deoxy-delta-3,4-glucoseen reductase [Noviherbaspirillum suwonense]|jgi:NAD(P)H-flavin reductase/ferredoxin|uniref:CDP-4-dehydro-6-deoxyglucose reductase/3-phenylpropionate/trans-cinnamate dioxygenase ferredoxin reductase subunit n=1 Tax=Noviherbaspirillum suwonense TaxID=1224511 RepID=A0ABY1Q942_9BURK|nr:CDP-6-deoxy-delta-3,4-glucoseen reductase [Noviherbaspirillum suwonense]SMP63650.1 CDP-4-dehydro-6-deoxyglucose reductase/3-phenylpropionate/trans-cinnamate dioxygenase ferredoxin reductase subunit [Noviherbaspirillum suwonense]